MSRGSDTDWACVTHGQAQPGVVERWSAQSVADGGRRLGPASVELRLLPSLDIT